MNVAILVLRAHRVRRHDHDGRRRERHLDGVRHRRAHRLGARRAGAADRRHRDAHRDPAPLPDPRAATRRSLRFVATVRRHVRACSPPPTSWSALATIERVLAGRVAGSTCSSTPSSGSCRRTSSRSSTPSCCPGHDLTSVLYQVVGPLFWAVFIVAAVILMRQTRSRDGIRRPRSRAASLVRRYGGGTLGFMATWPGNVYWFSEDRDGRRRLPRDQRRRDHDVRPDLRSGCRGPRHPRVRRVLRRAQLGAGVLQRAPAGPARCSTSSAGSTCRSARRRSCARRASSSRASRGRRCGRP